MPGCAAVNASKKSSKNSPWSTGPGSTSKSSSSNKNKPSSQSGSNHSKAGNQGNKSTGKGSKLVQSVSSTPSLNSREGISMVPSGTGFGSTAVEVKPPVQVYKLTPPLTPQLLVSPEPLQHTHTHTHRHEADKCDRRSPCDWCCCCCCH